MGVGLFGCNLVLQLTQYWEWIAKLYVDHFGINQKLLAHPEVQHNFDVAEVCRFCICLAVIGTTCVETHKYFWDVFTSL